MKKLLVILGLLSSATAYAGTISIQPWISSNDVTIAHLETQRTTLQNVINGSIEGGSTNIKAGSITSSDVATSINLNQFRKEAFNAWTYTGMLPATSASLTSAISAGISYINGVRVQTDATNHSYTASKDTYVYINSGGFFEYSEVANGGTAPATPANDLLLAKAVTNGTTISSVSDLRTTSIQITVNGSNFPADFRDQAVVVRDSTTAMHMEPGVIGIGSSLYTGTSDTSSLSTATPGNWIEGTVPNLVNQKFYAYAYNNSGSTFSFKYASADPVYSDSSSNTGGTLQYYTTGGTTYRAMAWVSADTSGLIQTYNFGNFPSGTTVNSAVFETGAVATGTTAVPDDDTIPTSSEGDQYMAITFKPVNVNDILEIQVTIYYGHSTGNQVIAVSLFQDSTTAAIATSAKMLDTNQAGNIQFQTFSHYMIAGTTSPTTFKVRAGGSTGATFTFNGVAGARKYGGVLASSIKVIERAA